MFAFSVLKERRNAESKICSFEEKIQLLTFFYIKSSKLIFIKFGDILNSAFSYSLQDIIPLRKSGRDDDCLMESKIKKKSCSFQSFRSCLSSIMWMQRWNF